jgi:ABC-type branched-subunit amino acid transport system ATPase component
LGDELVVLNEGKKLAEGTIEQISEKPEVLEIFGGFAEARGA